MPVDAAAAAAAVASSAPAAAADDDDSDLSSHSAARDATLASVLELGADVLAASLHPKTRYN